VPDFKVGFFQFIYLLKPKIDNLPSQKRGMTDNSSFALALIFLVTLLIHSLDISDMILCPNV
jgi:hypothetical protein